MKFTLDRDLTHASVLGHTVKFKKDEPTHVPAPLYREVQALGAVPDDEDEMPAAGGNPNEPKDPAKRYSELVGAFEALTLRNNREDFTAGGTPHLRPLAEVLGWTVSAQERDRAWSKSRAAD